MFRQNLNVHGIDSAASESQIIPVLIGESEDAVAAADELARHHLLAVAMRPPTVPPGTARLRLSVTLAHEPDDLVRAADRITQCTGCAAAPS
jgi:8-amino-7-oxononanoate synthase